MTAVEPKPLSLSLQLQLFSHIIFEKKKHQLGSILLMLFVVYIIWLMVGNNFSFDKYWDYRPTTGQPKKVAAYKNGMPWAA